MRHKYNVQFEIQTRGQSCDHKVSLEPVQETCIMEFPTRRKRTISGVQVNIRGFDCVSVEYSQILF